MKTLHARINKYMSPIWIRSHKNIGHPTLLFLSFLHFFIKLLSGLYYQHLNKINFEYKPELIDYLKNA